MHIPVAPPLLGSPVGAKATSELAVQLSSHSSQRTPQGGTVSPSRRLVPELGDCAAEPRRVYAAEPREARVAQ